MDNKRLIREKYFLKRKRLFFEIKQTYFQPLINIIKKSNNKRKTKGMRDYIKKAGKFPYLLLGGG